MQILDETLRKFVEDVSLIFQENLFEIIIHGSIVLNDFKPYQGDIDFIVLTNHDWPNKINLDLINLHKKYRLEKKLLLHQLEGTYYPKSFMVNPNEYVSGFYIGTTKMKAILSRQNSYVDLRLISRKGLMLLSSNSETYNPSEADLLHEQRLELQGFRRTIDNKSKVDIGFWISLIHWCARTLFYRAKGIVGSKTEACKWCKEQNTLVDYHNLFDLAKDLRYPYPDELTQATSKRYCISLLDQMGHA